MVIKHLANPLLPAYHVLTGQQELEAARSTDCSKSSSSAIGGGVVGGFVAGVLITIVLAIIILLLIGWKWYI